MVNFRATSLTTNRLGSRDIAEQLVTIIITVHHDVSHCVRSDAVDTLVKPKPDGVLHKQTHTSKDSLKPKRKYTKTYTHISASSHGYTHMRMHVTIRNT